MTHLSMENMNGVSRLMLRRISGRVGLTLNDIVPPDGNPISEDDLGLDPKGLSPNFAPWWVQPPLRPDEVTTQRGTPTPGELRRTHSEDRFSNPMTPSMDARDLKNSFTGRRLDQFKRRDFPGQYPHTWTPYEEIRTATGPEKGPSPPGWGPVPSSSALRQGAIDAGGNVPWETEDNMAHDISGFSSLHEMNGMASLSLVIGRRVRAKVAEHLSGMDQIPGMVTSYDQLNSPAGQAAVGAVTKTATTAAAQGAAPSTIEQIISFGAKAAAAALGSRAGLPPPQPVQASMIPQFMKSGDNTALYVGGGLALAAAVTVAVLAGRKKGRR